MALSDRLLEELHRALRARDALRVSTIRLARAAILSECLPPPLPEAEVRALVNEAVAQTGAKGPQDMGRVIGVLMPKVKSRTDGVLVSRLVREALGVGS